MLLLPEFTSANLADLLGSVASLDDLLGGSVDCFFFLENATGFGSV